MRVFKISKIVLIAAVTFLAGLPSPAAAEISYVSPFVAPDQTAAAFSHFAEGANASLYTAGYIFTNAGMAAELIRSKERGLDVVVMVERFPVGGILDTEKKIICLLKEHDVPVFLYHKKGAFLHAKYAVADNASVFVSTENFVNSRNRGWGAIVLDEGLAEEFARTFFKDLLDAQQADIFCQDGWKVNMQNKFSEKMALKKFKAARVEGIFGPPVTAAVVRTIKKANKSIYAEQFVAPLHWEDDLNPFLTAVIERAGAGVGVKVLLDGSWYNLKKNLEAIRYLKDVAKKDGLALEARLVDAEALQVEKLHAKGLVIDDKIALISSINWASHSAEKNREVGILIEDDGDETAGGAAAFFAKIFIADWESRPDLINKEAAKENLFLLLVLLPVSTILILISLGRNLMKRKK